MTVDVALQSRFRGCLLGGAVGDALGAPVEFMSADEIRARFGPAGIADYVPAYGRLGAITDDTQMTLFTAEGLIRAYFHGATRDIASVRSVVAGAYLRWLRTQERSPDETPDDGWLMEYAELFSQRAPGITCMRSLHELRGGDRPAANNSKGCGGVMRMAPVGMAFVGDRSTDARAIFDLGCELAAITHGHPTGYLSAGAFAVVVAAILSGKTLRDGIEQAKARLVVMEGHAETLDAMEQAVSLADKAPASVQTVERLGEGWVAEEALAIGLYCALVAKDFESGVVLAVNHGGDSDSTGSIAGNLLGAMQGVEAIPGRWLESLELRAVIEEVADDLANHRDWRLDDPSVRGRVAKRYPHG